MNDVGGMLCTKVTFRSTVNCDASVRIQAVKKWFERCLLLLIIFGKKAGRNFWSRSVSSVLRVSRSKSIPGMWRAIFHAQGIICQVREKPTNGQHEGKTGS